MSIVQTKTSAYLPTHKINHASKHHALKFKLCGESLLSTPKTAIIDGIVSYGGSTGTGLKLARKAFGEFYERNHLFTQVRVDEQKKLSDIEPKSHRDKLARLCRKKANAPTCLDHHFDFTRVNNLFDETAHPYFYNAISLNCNQQDSAYINFSDSCGAASHPCKQSALYNSLMEFIERQALLGSWLSKTYQYTINPELLRQISPYTELVDLLLENGELVIVQNGNQLPGHTVILFYFSHSEADKVKYAIGSSSGLTLTEALGASLEELYQCYSFLYNSESAKGLENKAGAGYHLAFEQCNHMDIRQTIPFMHNIKPHQISTLEQLYQARRYTYQDILDELSIISKDIYYYHEHDKALGLHYTKLLSPDFFTHMALNSQLNVENCYSKLLGIKKETAFMGKIPFP